VEIKKWHQRYLNDPTATDVISFSMREGAPSKSQQDILGDILISVDTAKRQAKLYGKSLNEELTLYMIHGVLHLLGYDDLVPRKKKVMERLQFSLLEKTMGKANEKKKKRA
jgi:rRNA maturation RNase YbeY